MYALRSLITINVPVVFMARYVMILRGATYYSLFFAPLKLLTNFENATEMKPSSEFLCDCSKVFSADLSLAVGKMRKNKLVTNGFGMILLTESRAASCKHFHFFSVQNHCIRVFEACYFPKRLSKLVISKEQVETLSLCTESTCLLLFSQNIRFVTQSI